MTPLAYKLLWTASLVTFTFGALAFSSLTLFYWRQRRQQHAEVRGVFPVFTMLCAAAFLLNLAQQADSRLAWLVPLMDLVTGLVPALLVHLVAQEERSGPRWLPAVFYANCGAFAIAVAAADAGLLPASWGDRLESAPAGDLAAAAVVALALQAFSKRIPSPVERRHRWWMRVLLALLVANSAASIWQSSPLFSLIPDYLLLAIFCVTLYYKERLVFFDLLLKRGAFLGVSFLVLGAVFLFAPAQPLLQALVLAPLWLAAPWIYTRLSNAIDRVCLRRRYTAAEAERRFVATVQAAESEEDLRARAAAAIQEIFEAPASVRFDGAAQPPPAELAAEIGSCGWVTLQPRANCIPYLSDDRHLLQSLARTLGVVLENVRFRERERQLHLLASRAELKALRAQINPHFLFNALNAIAGLIHTNQQAAEETVEQLAEVFRYTLRKSANEWVRLDEEIEFVTAYLRVEQSRFGERLAVEIAVDPAAAAIQVPAMCIQPLVENAIKHGTSQVERRGHVSLRATLETDALIIEVSDNGPGFPEPQPPTHSRFGEPGPGSPTPDPRPPTPAHGLRNVADRLSGYYGSAASLACTNGPIGARVSLRIPRNGLRRDASPDRR